MRIALRRITKMAVKVSMSRAPERLIGGQLRRSHRP
jgi:hypothetical protein